MSHFVFSTMAASVTYIDYIRGEAGAPPRKGMRVTIKGGAGIATKELVTPLGIVTEVNDEELAALEKNPVFLVHKKNGFVTVQAREKSVAKVVTSMAGINDTNKDPSMPKTPADYKKPPKVGADKP